MKLASHRHSDNKYAMKVYDKFKLNDQMKKKAVQREITVLKKIDHPNVIKMHEMFDTTNHLYLLTEYVSGVSL